MIFYSKSTGNFYDKRIHGDAIPFDAVCVTSEKFEEMLAARSSGKIIDADESGHPIAIDQSVPVRTKASLLVDVATKRWTVEVGGIIVGSTPIATDRESQSQLNGSYSSLKNGLIADTHWKSADGKFTRATLAELEPIAQAVAEHVRASFSAEQAHNEAISALKTQEDLDSYDINVGWPSCR
ncbi:DUF4376 domain-containing protein [Aeromonas hydrophila]|uniref:DUF4376 domain-containing protein n=1 Tax=Aeromonas hydrophila TaxID=644 RepID=UPI001FC85B78|nr:DUF4376 domain-containing protein [Aeromonas hydrophila]GKQ95958.1 hypothetical protein KAM461_02080 [Aeromonas hydrophila]